MEDVFACDWKTNHIASALPLQSDADSFLPVLKYQFDSKNNFAWKLLLSSVFAFFRSLSSAKPAINFRASRLNSNPVLIFLRFAYGHVQIPR